MSQNLVLPKNLSRINVIGSSGSGKSTFAKKISSALDLPYIEIDQIFWGPNWTQPSDKEFFAKLQNALSEPRWVLDGNYTRTVPLKWEQIDLVIWLDYSFARTLFQSIWRAATRAWSQQELWPGTGNRESFRKSFFSKESIVWWMITHHKQVRKKYEGYMSSEKFSHIKFVRLKSHAEARIFLNRLRGEDS